MAAQRSSTTLNTYCVFTCIHFRSRTRRTFQIYKNEESSQMFIDGNYTQTLLPLIRSVPRTQVDVILGSDSDSRGKSNSAR